jgi:uncharacterized membrane protein
MIETLRTLVTDPGFPNLHVIVVHFPIAFIVLAPLLDFACLVFRRHMWLDRAATLLYVLGAVGAGAAYLTGQRAAESLANLSPAAESALADHEGFAVFTLIGLAVVSLVRFMVSWLSRDDRRIRIGFFRLVALPIALAGLLLVAVTADRGGCLVYGHGLGTGSHSAAENPD